MKEYTKKKKSERILLLERRSLFLYHAMSDLFTKNRNGGFFNRYTCKYMQRLLKADSSVVL